MLCCESMTDSDVAKCNLRLRNNPESMVGGIIKDSILKFCFVWVGSKDALLEDIEAMELRDKEGLLVKKKGKKVN